MPLPPLIRRPLEWVLSIASVRRVLIRHYHGRRAANDPWNRLHPIDEEYGIETSGMVPTWLIATRGVSHRQIVWYAGSQPLVTRRALRRLSGVDRSAFVDIGCGKGRVLALATEFPFREILGVEMSPSLADIARRNVRTVTQRYPDRTAISVRTGDALDCPLPDGDLVLFLYHPFDCDLMARLLLRIEQRLQATTHRTWIVYYNPVCGELFDRSPGLTRLWAETVTFDTFGNPSESKEHHDAYVIWQDRAGARGGPALPPEAHRRIVVTMPGVRAELVDDRVT